MMGRMVRGIVLSALLAGCGLGPGTWSVSQASALLPDLYATPAAALYLQPDGKGMNLRFSNTIANIGAGPFQLRAHVEGNQTVAVQEVLDAAGNVVQTQNAGRFEYHPTHHHTHVDSVARYELHRDAPDGPLVIQAKKVSYCMEDTIQYGAGGPRFYAHCTPELQGVSPGWADVYANDVPDQDLSVTGLPAGIYYLVTTVDPTQKFLDANRSNNVSWVKIDLDPANYRLERLDESSQAPSSVTGEGQYWRPFWRGI